MTGGGGVTATAAAAEGLPFTGPWLLAPMEGVTDPAFRGVVLSRHREEVLGGAFTEFVRVVDHPLPNHVLRRHLGQRRFPIPVGLQLMGADLAALAGTAARAVEVGAPLIDLNFGCPARGALRGCAGASILREPDRLRSIVATVVDAVAGARPVTAKIRAGYDDPDSVEVLARAAEDGGARMLTVHCRTKTEGYCDEVDWSRVARAVEAVTIPVCGNGGVADHGDLERMRRETGCRYVMVGHAALRDPWVFSGRRVDRREAARFLLDYAAAMGERDMTSLGQSKRVKQLLRIWTAGDLAVDRGAWLRETDPERLFFRLAEIAGRPMEAESAVTRPMEVPT